MATNNYATGKSKLIEPGHGNYPDEWDSPVNSNWGVVDALVGGLTTIDVSSISPSSPSVTLVFQTYATNIEPWTAANAGQNLCIRLTGFLAADISVFVPSGVKGFWFIDNRTAGNHTVTIKTTNVLSVGPIVRQSSSTIVYCDGTNVLYADSGIVDPSTLVPVGAIQAFAGTTPPAYWLPCDGSAVSRTTYANLFAVIGTTWGVGDSSTTFNVPDLRNMFLRGAGASAVGVYESDDFKSHTHALTDPGHVHDIQFQEDDRTAGTGAYSFQASSTTVKKTESAKTGVTIDNTGGTETRPVNKRVLYIIRY